jgi:methionine-S-sulfoxide reductase
MKTVFAAALAVLALSGAGLAQDDYLRPATADGADLPDGLAHAVFASGCFWCTEADFEKLDGVVEVVSGFAGGNEPNPDYYDVARGRTGHNEAARVIYDPAVVSYDALLDHYWRNVDPFDANGQFCDRGSGYAPAIFTVNAEQDDRAQASRQQVQDRFDDPIIVPIRPLDTFWPAGAEHQDYADNQPLRYQRYRFGCRRDARLRQIWG